MNELNEMRNLAYDNNLIYKSKVKAWHDRQISFRSFMPGQKVWLFDAKLKLFPDKLRSKWKGPFIISKDNSNGSFQLFDEKTNSSPSMGNG